MNRVFRYGFLGLILLLSAYYSYSGFKTIGCSLSSIEIKTAGMFFVFGFTLALIFSELIIEKLKAALGAYKRELEKESIEGTEQSSKVKVLESKIKVLEKALEDALNK